MHHNTYVTHVPWCMPGSLTSGFFWSRRRGKTFPAFPAHAQPVILRIWQEAHSTGTTWKRFPHCWYCLRRTVWLPLGSPHERPVMGVFGVFFMVNWNRVLNKQSSSAGLPNTGYAKIHVHIVHVNTSFAKLFVTYLKIVKHCCSVPIRSALPAKASP